MILNGKENGFFGGALRKLVTVGSRTTNKVCDRGQP